MTRFFKGTMILIIAGLITRILGFINRIVLARYVGEEGVGLFMMAQPTLFLVIAATQIGLPVAISKFVAEANANNDTRKMKSILIISLSVTSVLSMIFTPLLFLGARFLSENLFTDHRVYYPLLAMVPIIPITAISAVLRGYFQGKQQMNPYAFSQILEQIVRISLIALLTKKFLPYGIEFATTGAIFAAIVGEFASLIYLLTCFKIRKKFRLRKKYFSYLWSGRDTLRELMSIAIPTTGSRMIGSIAWFLEPIVVSQSLAIAGFTAVNATKLYGELTGYALPLLMLPSFITVSLGTSLIPAISEAYAKKKYRLVEYQLQQSLRFTFLSGALSVVIIYVLADPLMYLMFGTNHAAHYVKFLSPFFLFFFYQGPLQAALQAMDMAPTAMFNSFVGAVVKTVMIFALATQPRIGIMGVSIALGFNIMLITFLHFYSISRKIHLPIYLREYVLTGIIMFATGYVGRLLFESLLISFSIIQRVILTTIIMSVLFIIFILISGIYKKNEIERIPYIGKLLGWIFISK
jgi:stage V sporulation protein B